MKISTNRYVISQVLTVVYSANYAASMYNTLLYIYIPHIIIL